MSDAVRGAVERASHTIEDLSWFEVDEIRGRIGEGQVTEYQVKVKLGFRIHASTEETGDARRTQAERGPTPQTRTEMAQIGTLAGQKKKDQLARSAEEQPRHRQGE